MGPWGVSPTHPTAAARVFASPHADVLLFVVVVVVVVGVVAVAVVVASVVMSLSAVACSVILHPELVLRTILSIESSTSLSLDTTYRFLLDSSQSHPSSPHDDLNRCLPAFAAFLCILFLSPCGMCWTSGGISKPGPEFEAAVGIIWSPRTAFWGIGHEGITAAPLGGRRLATTRVWSSPFPIINTSGCFSPTGSFALSIVRADFTFGFLQSRAKCPGSLQL